MSCYSRADKQMESFQIYLNRKVLKCEIIVKHLGIYMTHTNSDGEDINRKRENSLADPIISLLTTRSCAVKHKVNCSVHTAHIYVWL